MTMKLPLNTDDRFVMDEKQQFLCISPRHAQKNAISCACLQPYAHKSSRGQFMNCPYEHR